jgi:hypothetical protein
MAESVPGSFFNRPKSKRPFSDDCAIACEAGFAFQAIV